MNIGWASFMQNMHSTTELHSWLLRLNLHLKEKKWREQTRRKRNHLALYEKDKMKDENSIRILGGSRKEVYFFKIEGTGE